MADKPKKVIRTTPPGVFIWPKLARPDEYKGKKSYSVKVRLPADDEWAQKFIRAIDKMADEKLAEAIANDKRPEKKKAASPWKLAPKPYDNELEKDTEEETGNVLFKFKANYEGKKKDGTPWVRKSIRMFDAKGKPFKLTEDAWNGTEGCVSFEMRSFAQGPDVGAGVTLSIEAVQIIKLVTGGEGNADQYGFGSHDDGFDADDAPKSTDETSKDEADGQADVAGAADDDDF